MCLEIFERLVSLYFYTNNNNNNNKWNNFGHGCDFAETFAHLVYKFKILILVIVFQYSTVHLFYVIVPLNLPNVIKSKKVRSVLRRYSHEQKSPVSKKEPVNCTLVHCIGTGFVSTCDLRYTIKWNIHLYLNAKLPRDYSLRNYCTVYIASSLDNTASFNNKFL